MISKQSPSVETTKLAGNPASLDSPTGIQPDQGAKPQKPSGKTSRTPIAEYLDMLDRTPQLAPEVQRELGKIIGVKTAAAEATLLQSDFVARKCLQLLAAVHRKRLGLKRVVFVSQLDTPANTSMRDVLSDKSQKIAGILKHNRQCLISRLSKQETLDRREDLRVQHEIGRYKQRVLLSEVKIKWQWLSEFKDQLQLFALQTQLLQVRLKLALLESKRPEGAPNARTSADGRDGAQDEHQQLLQQRTKIKEELREHKSSRGDFEGILRSPEEIRGLQRVLNAIEAQRCPASQIREGAERIRTIVHSDAELKESLAKLTKLESKKYTYDDLQEYERDREALVEKAEGLRDTLAKLDSGEYLPNRGEIWAMRGALRCRLIALGEAPKAALLRAKQRDKHLSEAAIAEEALVKGNLRFVVSRAKKFRNRGVDIMDLIQEGNKGLARAGKTFDYKRGTTFLTYAGWWVREALEKAVCKQSGTTGISSEEIYRARKLERRIRTLEQSSQRLMTDDQRLAVYLEGEAERAGAKNGARMKDASVDRLSGNRRRTEEKRHALALRMHRQVVSGIQSLDAPTRSDENKSVKDFAEGREDTGQQQVDGADLWAVLQEAMQCLEEREIRILNLRLALDGEQESLTLEEVGKLEKISRERVRQVEEKALQKLKEALQEKPQLMEWASVLGRPTKNIKR